MAVKQLPYDAPGRLVLRRLLGQPPFGYVVLNYDGEYTHPDGEREEGSFFVFPNGFDKYGLRDVPCWRWFGDCWRFPATATTIKVLDAYGDLLLLAANAWNRVASVLDYDPTVNGSDGTALCAFVHEGEVSEDWVPLDLLREHRLEPEDLEVIPEEQDFAEREEGVQREQTSEARPVANEAYDPGDVIAGQFEVIERLGFGGFARVYRVRWIMNDREYALKVFRTSDSIDTVKREIKALQAVSHPRIVNVVWGGETSDGQGYIVSELLDGETLEAYATGEKWLSLAEAVRVAFELLEGLGAIHPDSQRIKDLEARGKAGEIEIEEYEELRALKGRGLVHRDIKPQNLLLTRRGIVLIDFGVASRVGDRVLTVRGTPPYQPPDIIPGADTWDVSPDLFAAGVVLYQLVCHEHPYQNWEPCLDQEPREPRQFRPELPAEFVEFLTRACAPRRQDRSATADEMRAALDTASTRLW